MRDFHRPGRSAVYALEGMAATSAPLATLAAIEVLKAGGNAVDAAVTASAVLCVAEPAMTGIGGDCFALVGMPDGTVRGLNGSGRAAMRADADWLKSSGLDGIPRSSPHSVTVPGAIHAWNELLKVHGRMTLAQALAPAIALADCGVPVTPRVAADWQDDETLLQGDEGGRRHFLKDGRAPLVGDTMAYPALARTLRLIAGNGPQSFYDGEIAAEIVSHLDRLGGLLTREDFARHRSNWVEPIETEFRGHGILEMPPNGQGLTALLALNILGRFGLGRHGADSAERAHLEIEAMKLAWHYRGRHIADPDFAAIPVATLLSGETAGRLAALIDMKRALDIRTALPESDTVYLCVVDRDRLAASFINSVYSGFGSGIVLPVSGFALHNRGSGFVTEPGHPNCIGPGKRPLHTIIPALVRKHGLTSMVYGVMGGGYQPMGHVTVAVNRYVHGMDPQAAIDWPRYFPRDGKVLIETGVSDAVRGGLAQRGHDLEISAKPLGGAQAIAIDRERGVLCAGSDPRKDGLALGY